MTDVKLILSDIDGTILNDDNKVDSNLKSIVHKLREQAIPFVLASARSPEGMREIAKELDVVDNPIACYNGALVIKDIQSKDYSTILSHELNLNEVKKIISIIHQKFAQVSINLYSGADWYVEKKDQWVQIESDITKLDPIETNLDELVANCKVPIHKLLLIGQSTEISQVLKLLNNNNFDDSSFYLSKPNYLEITNNKVSKETALRELAKTYDITVEQTMTLGDNFNDIPMLKIAGLGVAMQNAPEEVKNCANEVTETNNRNGVSRAIEKYVL